MRPIDADLMKAEVALLDVENNNNIYRCAMEDMLQFFVELIDKQPALKPEVKHGRWKKKNGEIYCTNCKKSKWVESFELMLHRFNFCPNCGADMREVSEDVGTD